MTKAVDVVIPVLNEEKDLSSNVRKLHGFLEGNLPDCHWRIVIFDNGSTDSTAKIALLLSDSHSRVGYMSVKERGRGRALRKAWQESDADIVSYMDVDLSTDLLCFPRLVAAVKDDGYDIAIGSRLTKGAQVIGRPLSRELISRTYSLTFRAMFHTRFRDAQCGFKVVNRRVVTEVLPLVKNTGWFFDTELLILAEKNGYRIKEVPVRWTDDSDSRVKIIGTAYEDLKGLVRLRFGGLRKASRELDLPNGSS